MRFKDWSRGLWIAALLALAQFCYRCCQYLQTPEQRTPEHDQDVKPVHPVLPVNELVPDPPTIYPLFYVLHVGFSAFPDVDRERELWQMN